MRKKLTLNVEELTVESFDTNQPAADDRAVRRRDFWGWSDDSVCPTVTDGRRCCPQ
ncbi:MAG TPA: hypothetical protein VFX98_17885 [Longimicrobiaceae bacterium]|nr:hypothetical protein [Longimicrobiaceae bacterium]